MEVELITVPSQDASTRGNQEFSPLLFSLIDPHKKLL